MYIDGLSFALGVIVTTIMFLIFNIGDDDKDNHAGGDDIA